MSDPAPPAPPTVSADSDQPLRRDAEDRLGFGVYADALSRLIQDEATGTPLVVAINARWGAGKSSLANLIERRLTRQRELEGEAPYVICRFNAWMHDDAANLRTAFSATVARTADQARSFLLRRTNPLPPALLSPRERILVYLPIYVFGALILLAPFYLWNKLSPGSFAQATQSLNESLSKVFNEASDKAKAGSKASGEAARNTAAAAFLALVVGYAPKIYSVGTAVAGFVRNPVDAANRGTVLAVREQLGTLIRQATLGRNQRFVVFVDDIERCQCPRPIEVLEAVNQLVDHPNVVVVLMGDMPAVAANAGLKYKELACVHNPDALVALEEREAIRLYGYRYMQKIVQLQFDVPSDVEITAKTLSGAPEEETEWVREAAQDAYGVDLEQEEREAKPLSLKTAVFQPFVAGRALASQSGLSERSRLAFRSLHAALIALQAASLVPLAYESLLALSKTSGLESVGRLSLWSAALLVGPALASIAARCVYDPGFRKQPWRLPYLAFQALAPPPAFLWEQLRFPKSVFASRERVRLILLSVVQALLAVAFLGLAYYALSSAANARRYDFNADGYVPIPFDSSGFAINFGLTWIGVGGLGLVVRRTFASVVRDGLTKRIARLADEAGDGRFDPETAREEIYRALDAAGSLSSSQRAQLRRSVRQSSGVFQVFFRREKQKRLIANDDDVDAAVNVALPMLPPLPRNAKRIRNAIRLMMYVMRIRKLMPDPVSPEAVGKWAALREGWPHIAERLIQDPKLLSWLEPGGKVAKASDVESIVASEMRAHAGDHRLLALLAAPYDLTPVVRCVARLGSSS